MRGGAGTLILIAVMGISACAADGEGSTGAIPSIVDSTVGDDPPETSASDVTDATTAQTTATLTTVPTTTDPPRQGEATLAFTGDTLIHSPLWRRAQNNNGGSGYDYAPMFVNIAPRISAADYAICHLEVPIAPADEDYTTFPLFGVQPEVITGLADTGYDRCSTASNHALDRGSGGVDRTVEVLEAHGLTQTGMARTPDERLPDVFDVNGISIGHLSFTYGTNGIPLPNGEPWRTNLINVDQIAADSAALRERGADIVIVSLHWGTEGQTAPNSEQEWVAETITANGSADLIIGHHAHVLQPIEQRNGVWVVFGLSNIISNLPTSDRWPASSQDAAIVEFDIVADDSGSVSVGTPRVIPTWVDKGEGWVVRDVVADLDRADASESTLTAMEQSLQRTESVLGEFVVR